MDCCTPERVDHLPLYAQLFSIGLLWTSVHCAGMCGPIMVGLTAGTGGRGRDGKSGVARAAAGVLSYQGGRAVMYALLGAGAGLAGAALEVWVQGVTKVAGLVLALALLGAGAWAFPGAPWASFRRRLDTGTGATTGRWIGTVLRRLDGVLPNRRNTRMAMIGFALGLLPCMLTFWVLGLAASSADPLHGALLMLGLVLMTTPVLTLAGCSTALAGRRRWRVGTMFVPLALMFSGVWVGLVAAAANGWIAHLSVPFRAFGRDLVLMLW